MRLSLRLGSGLRLFQGFPVCGSISVSLATASLAPSDDPGTTRASQVPDASLHAYHALCGPRQTLQNLTRCGPFVLASGTLKPSPSASYSFTRLYQALGSAVSPAVYVVPCVRFNCFVRLPPFFLLIASYSVATLGTGGWLGLTRWGLSPHKKRQASLGALTPRIKLCKKPTKAFQICTKFRRLFVSAEFCCSVLKPRPSLLIVKANHVSFIWNILTSNILIISCRAIWVSTKPSSL